MMCSGSKGYSVLISPNLSSDILSSVLVHWITNFQPSYVMPKRKRTAMNEKRKSMSCLVGSSQSQHIRSTYFLGAFFDGPNSLALSSQHITVVVHGAAGVTVTGLAAVWVLREAIVLRQTLVTVSASHKALAGTLTSQHVAAQVVDGPQQATGALCKNKTM